MRTFHTLFLVFLLAGSLRAEEIAEAVDSEPPEIQDPLPVLGELETTVFTASRFEETWLQTPYRLEILTDERLQERIVRTLPESLEETPGVFVQKTSHGQGAPFIRGFTGYHTLMLIDGIRLNHAAFRSGPNQYWNTVDPLSLRRMELVPGQGSVLYGSDSVGGTLQAFTKRPEYAEQGFHSGGRSYSRLSSGERSWIQRNEYSISEAGEWGLLVGGSWKSFGDIRAAELGRLPKTNYEEWDADAKLEIFLNDFTRLTFLHQQVHVNDAWRTHKTIFSKSFAGTTIGNEPKRVLDQDRYLTYLQLEGEPLAPLFDSYTLSVSHQRHEERRLRERADGRFDRQGFDIDAFSLWAQFDKELPNTTVAYGASYDYEMADSFRKDFNADGTLRARRIQGPIGDDATYHLLGAFVNTSTPFGERLDIDLGARYTYAGTDIGQVQDPNTGNPFSIEDSWHNVVGSGRFSYKLDQAGSCRLFGGISQAFRAPNFSDLSRLDTARSNEIETAAPGLDPEHFTTFEIGLKKDTGNFSGSAALFYTDIQDLIVRTPTGNVVGGDLEVTKQNAGDGYVGGVELAGRWEFAPGWTAFGGFAWIDGEVSTFPTSAPVLVDEPISRLMPTNGHVGVRYDSHNGRWWAEALMTVFDEQDDLSTRDAGDTQRIPPGGTPGFWLATIRGGFQVKENIQVTAAVENLFDEAYRTHGSGQNEPGINAILGVEITF